MDKKKFDFDKTLGKTVQTLVKSVSWIILLFAIMIASIMVLGTQVDIDITSTDFQTYAATISILSIVIYTTFISNGQADGKNDLEYKSNFSIYSAASIGRDKKKINEFLKFKKTERIDNYIALACEEASLTEKQVREMTIKELRHHGVSLFLLRHLINIRKHKYPNIAYKNAEQLLSLTANESNNKNGETKATAERTYYNAGIAKKIILTIIFSCFGAAIAISSVLTTSWQESIVKLFFGIITFTMSLVGGYQIGFKGISVVRKNILATGIRYLGDYEMWLAQNGYKEERIDPKKWLLKEEKKEEENKVEKENTVNNNIKPILCNSIGVCGLGDGKDSVKPEEPRPVIDGDLGTNGSSNIQ